jgi:multicomponent Na+:H+ antiporter subunit B
MAKFSSVILLLGLGVLGFAIYQHMNLQVTPLIGDAINSVSAGQVGAGNIVTSVVLAYRGFDTMLEITILFTAATVGGMVLGKPRAGAKREPDAGFILQLGSDLLFPLLLIVGLYIILHGHLTPGGGFQGGVVLAAAFFVPVLARPGKVIDHHSVSLIEGLSGATFIIIGLLAMAGGEDFLTPLLGKGLIGTLFSAGTLPLLYIAVGLKVGAELAGLLESLSQSEGLDEC